MSSGDHSAVRFLLDGELHDVGHVPPTTTVLQYLRDHLHRTGTKEGCAEGDCGACTVVIVDLDGDDLVYRATNSCIQFLPTLDGKALITVESLKSGGDLHPVQRAMVDCHGSQCGFCTPGFVMSLYALYKTNKNPGRDDIQYALSGNLCRCTGYRPILDAAEAMFRMEDPTPADFEPRLKTDLAAIRVESEKVIQTDGGNYYAPATVDELCARLAAVPDATILAGGTDVGLWVTKQHADLRDVIFVGNVAELHATKKDDKHIEIGAAVTLTDAFALLLEEYPDLFEIARRFASPPICNSGTLCGNVANGSPIGDSMPGLICLGAEVELRRKDGARRLPLEDFYLDYQKKDLAPGEFVASVRIPRAREGLVFRSYKISKRYDQDISAVCGAFSLELDKNNRVTAARVCYGGVATTPKRAPACEKALAGAAWNQNTLEAAVRALRKDFSPITDMRATSDYRTLVAGNLLRRFYAELANPGEAACVWSYAG